MTDLPAPPVPAVADLRDFQFYPMDIVRLFGSAFHAKANDAEWRAGITLWLKSYHQVPAGSLPDDDVELCRAAELGRDLKAWAKVRAVALRGWTKASDGRLYHETVTEKVLEAIQRKEAYRERSKKANAKRWNGVDNAPQSQGSQGGGKEQEAAASSNAKVIQQGSNKDHVRSNKTVLEPPKGQGQGQGQGIDTAAAPAEPCRTAAATADPLGMDSMQAAPPTPQRANFADWRIMVGKRCFVGREERSEWEALFHAEGWDAMTSAYEFLTNQNPEPSKLFLSSFQEIRA